MYYDGVALEGFDMQGGEYYYVINKNAYVCLEFRHYN